MADKEPVTGNRSDVLRPTDAEAIRLARMLMRSARYGSIAVLEPKTGSPLASRVAVASDHDGAPLILISQLAAHMGAIMADPRCSLMLGEPGKGDAMAHPRISLACIAEKIIDKDARHQRVKQRFLSHIPKAKLYAGLGDFAFFRLEPLSASLNGGFGKAFALTQENLLTASDGLEEIAAVELSVIEYMNSNHPDTLANYAIHFGKASKAVHWIMTGIDADGFNLAAGNDILRILFPSPSGNVPEMRAALTAMADEARQAAASLTCD